MAHQALDAFAGTAEMLGAQFGVHARAAVTVELRERAPVHSLDDWDHVVSGSVTFPSGRLRFRSPTHDGPSLRVQAGTYTFIARSSGLHDADQAVGGDEATDGPDRYELLFWPGLTSHATVYKQWAGALVRYPSPES